MSTLISDHINSIITLVTIFMAALVSPGPDFALIVKHSLTHSRKIAIYTALGIALGDIAHNIYILIGVGEFLINNELAMRWFTYIGATYLIYIGYQGIVSKPTSHSFGHSKTKGDITPKRAIIIGFMTCLLNPKAVLFITSMFAVVLTPETPVSIMFLYAIITFTQCFIWYVVVAIFLSTEIIRSKIIHIEHWINRVTGVILAGIGISLFLES
ncbi:MAG: amino acid transporter LysE [Pseudomonadota bacterium]|jgi:threonine/homoserine/homoserine lactone efflux protein